MVAWPDAADLDMGDGDAWDRQPGEPSRSYAAFRIYRDMLPFQRSLTAVGEQIGLGARRCQTMAQRWAWRDRADAWDDACHKVEDQERLEAIRSMHETHRKAGRAALVKALQALQILQPAELNAGQVARLMALGAKLERDTLIVSVEELQGFEPIEEDEDDPWERIARELDPNNATVDG